MLSLLLANLASAQSLAVPPPDPAVDEAEARAIARSHGLRRGRGEWMVSLECSDTRDLPLVYTLMRDPPPDLDPRHPPPEALQCVWRVQSFRWIRHDSGSADFHGGGTAMLIDAESGAILSEGPFRVDACG